MTRPGRITLEQWRNFQAVVDHGGFAAAAKRLHRSQSAISHSVAKLQQQLGMPLLQIEGRRARLTEAGEAILRQSRRLLQQAEELEQFAASLRAGWEAEIRLVVDEAFPTGILMAALRRFEPRCPSTRIQLSEEILSGVEETLAAGKADLAISSQPGNFPASPLLIVEFIAVAKPGHALLQLGRSLDYRDLERETQIVIRDSGQQKKRDVGWLGAQNRWSVGSLETATTAVREGLGFAWLPRHQVAHLLQQRALCELPLRAGKSYAVTLYLIFGRPGEPGPGTRQLAGILRELAALPQSPQTLANSRE